MTVAIIVACVVVHAPVHPPGVFYDDGQYFELALALRGGAYRHELMTPPLPAVHFPPGYPAWLMVWDAVGRLGGVRPFQMWWLLLGNAVLVVLGAVVLFVAMARAWARSVAPELIAIALTLGVVFPPSWVLWNTLMAESLAFALAALVVLGVAEGRRSFETGRTPDVASWWLTLAALCAGLLPVVRSVWVPLTVIVGLEAWRVLKKQAVWHQFLVFVLTLMPAVWWAVWVSKRVAAIPSIWAENYGSYAAFALPVWLDASTWPLLARFQWAQFVRIEGFVWAPFGSGVLALLAGVLGVQWMVARRRWAPLAVGFAYAGLVVTWPYWPDRFMWGVAPFVSLLLALGVSVAFQWAFRRPHRFSWASDVQRWGAVAFVVTATGYGTTTWLVRMVPMLRASVVFAPTITSQVRAAAPLVAYARQLPPVTIVAVPNDVVVRMWSGQPAIPFLPGVPGSAIRTPRQALGDRVGAALCVAPEGVALRWTTDSILAVGWDAAVANGMIVVPTGAVLPAVPAGLDARPYRCTRPPAVALRGGR